MARRAIPPYLVSGTTSPYFVLNGPNSNVITVIGPGNTGTGAISVTPSGGFSGLVNLSCAVQAPPGITQGIPTCSMNGASSTFPAIILALRHFRFSPLLPRRQLPICVEVTGTDAATGKITNSNMILALVIPHQPMRVVADLHCQVPANQHPKRRQKMALRQLQPPQREALPAQSV